MISERQTMHDDRFPTVNHDVWESSPKMSKELGREDAFEKSTDTKRTIGGTAISANFRLPYDDRTGKKDGSMPKHRAEIIDHGK